LLYDFGNIVLNLIIALSVATNCYHCDKKIKNKKYHRLPHEKLKGLKKVLFYKKCLTSNKYLSHKCRFHRLYKHIINKKENEKKEMSSELIAAFLLSIIGAIYLDSNLNKSKKDGIQLQNVRKFIQRFLPEVVLEEDIKNIIHLFRTKNNSKKQQSLGKQTKRQQIDKTSKLNEQRQQFELYKLHKLQHHKNGLIAKPKRNGFKNGTALKNMNHMTFRHDLTTKNKPH